MKLTGRIAQGPLPASESQERHKALRTWVVVADQRIARIFSKSGHKLELIGEALPEKIDRQKGIPDNSMGRVTSLHGSNRHKLMPRLEPGRHNAMNFAHDLSLWLEAAVQNDSFDRLILVAAPRTLGDIRSRLHKSVHDCIAAEINKELTKLNENALQEELKDIL